MGRGPRGPSSFGSMPRWFRFQRTRRGRGAPSPGSPARPTRGSARGPRAGARRPEPMMNGTAHSTALFEPDTLLPEQLVLPGRQAMQGERLLMLAVLEDALDCYRKYCRSREGATRLLFDETRAWVESRDHDTLFSFESICEAVDIHPDYLRRRLHETSDGGARRRLTHDADGQRSRRPARRA